MIDEIQPEMRVALGVEKLIKWWKIWKECSEEEKSISNLREIRFDEIILDYESEEEYQDGLEKLKKDKLYYIIIKTGSRGYHIHLFFKGMNKYDLNERNAIRETFIKKYNADIHKASEKTLISRVNKPHWKTGNMCELILSNNGINNLTEELIADTYKLLEMKKSFKIENLSDEEFKNYFEKDKFWLWASQEADWTKIPMHCNFNYSIVPNLAIACVKSGKTENDIEILMRPFFTKIKGYHFNSFLGWLKKASNGLIDNYNKVAIEFWREKYNIRKERFYESDFVELKESSLKSRGLIVTEEELANMALKKQEWVIQNLLPRNSLTVFAGKRSSFKSFFALLCCMCIAHGKKILDRFETKQCNVLYIDEENGEVLLQERNKIIKKGLGLVNEDNSLKTTSKILYTIYAGMRLSGDNIKKIIEGHKPDVLIIDTLRRVMGVDENDANVVNAWLTTILRPLMVEYNLTVILLHHMRKGSGQFKPADKLDELRGSSEFANYADNVLVFETAGKNKFVLSQEKIRNAQPVEPLTILIEGKEDSINFRIAEGEEAIVEREVICSLDILKWIESKDLKEFKTQECKDNLVGKKYGGNDINKALSLLKNRGKIDKHPKYKIGRWIVVEEKQQFLDLDIIDEALHDTNTQY